MRTVSMWLLETTTANASGLRRSILCGFLDRAEAEAELEKYPHVTADEDFTTVFGRLIEVPLCAPNGYVLYLPDHEYKMIWEHIEDHDDHGPRGYGWQSDGWIELVADIRAQIAAHKESE